MEVYFVWVGLCIIDVNGYLVGNGFYVYEVFGKIVFFIDENEWVFFGVGVNEVNGFVVDFYVVNEVVFVVFEKC